MDSPELRSTKSDKESKRKSQTEPNLSQPLAWTFFFPEEELKIRAEMAKEYHLSLQSSINSHRIYDQILPSNGNAGTAVSVISINN